MPNDPTMAEVVAHWDRLADEYERHAAWNRSRGIDMSAPGQSPGDHAARLFRATARACRLEMETGIPHCSTCFKAHPTHRHNAID